MKRLGFDYFMGIAYSMSGKKSDFTIKCIPMDTERQKLEEISIQLKPQVSVTRGEDSWGNQLIYGSVGEEHRGFAFHIRGVVQTGRAERENIKPLTLGRFRYPWGLTVPGEALLDYYRKLQIPDGSAYMRSEILMHRLHQDFCYEKNVTDVHTGAEEAWRLGKGVCQDYAHIMITLCRLAGMPARYVTGMLPGEGYSHAWVEVCAEDGWYGFDPTNNIVVKDEYIKLGIGRDAADCAINRGLVIGGGIQTQEVRVSVWEEKTDD